MNKTRRNTSALLFGSALFFFSMSALADGADPLVAKGRALLGTYECGRCHSGGPVTPAPQKKNCVACHRAIRDGEMKAKPEVLERWQNDVVHLLETPSFVGMNGRLRESWVASFLQEPRDVRPGLAATMPRFDMPADDAKAIARALAGKEVARRRASTGDKERGKRLLAQKACMTCHVFTGSGVTSMAESEPIVPPLAAISLAPDLAHTRERFLAHRLTAWIRNPAAMKKDTLMPNLGLTEEEAADIARFILEAELAPAPERMVPARLPVLKREVRFAEVEEKVLKKTCWHCHALPDFARGDGGAGNTGGFGFKARGLDLSSVRGVFSGSRDDHGKRRSIFLPVKSANKDVDGLPRLVAHMVARQYEEVGAPVDGVRGMPLGLPAPTREEVQLVESWIAQGRKR